MYYVKMGDPKREELKKQLEAARAKREELRHREARQIEF